VHDRGGFLREGDGGVAVIRVAVLGATGRMGSEACRAVETADDLELVASLGAADSIE
jgi:4-hydroxy-tetrahydrodipicolinate reductase